MMDAMKQQLTWQLTKDIMARVTTLNALQSGDPLGSKANSELIGHISDELDNLRERLRISREKIDNLAVIVGTVAPPVGAMVYHIDPHLRGLPCNRDPSGHMQLSIVKQNDYGLAIRFIADEDGPVLIIGTEEDGYKLFNEHHNMMRDAGPPGPLYRAGDLLEYRGPIGKALFAHAKIERSRFPTLEEASLPTRHKERVAIDVSHFNSGWTTLLLIKNNTTASLPEKTVYRESALDYTILNHGGYPRCRSDLTSTRSAATLKPITGRIISEAPLCSVISQLPEVFNVTEMLNKEQVSSHVRHIVYLTPSEMAIPIEPQVKSAAKKQ